MSTAELCNQENDEMTDVMQRIFSFLFACIYIYVLHIFFLWYENDWTVRMNPAFINMEPASYEIQLLKVSWKLEADHQICHLQRKAFIEFFAD